MIPGQLKIFPARIGPENDPAGPWRIGIRPMGSSGAGFVRARRVLAVLVTVLTLAAPGRAVRAEQPTADAALETRIQALRDERDRIRLAGPTAVVAVGAAVLQGGLSTIVSAQYNCPGYWSCSDETRWAITAGSGGAILIGAITLGFSVPVLTKRLRARRELSEEMNQLRASRPTARGKRPWPALTPTIHLAGERKGFALVFRY